jgi:hypothetical protein
VIEERKFIKLPPGHQDINQNLPVYRDTVETKGTACDWSEELRNRECFETTKM